eukprot:gene6839-30815_t
MAYLALALLLALPYCNAVDLPGDVQSSVSTQGGALPDAPVPVPSVRFELLQQLSSVNAHKVAFLGCPDVAVSFPELLKPLPGVHHTRVFILCTQEQCKGRSAGQPQLPGGVPQAGTSLHVVCGRDDAAHDHRWHSAEVLVVPAVAGTPQEGNGAQLKEWGLIGENTTVMEIMQPSKSATGDAVAWLRVRKPGPPASVHAFVERGHVASATFSHIYEKQLWGHTACSGGSGAGSCPESTTGIRAVLEHVFSRYGIRRMLDAPCGSFAWMHLLLEKMPQMEYVGGDIACKVVSELQQRYLSMPNWQFHCLDLCHQEHPHPVGLVFSRDALQHLPISYTFQYLERVKQSKARLLLVGSYLNSALNRVNTVGDYFPINLKLPPFNLTGIIHEYSEERWDPVHNSTTPIEREDSKYQYLVNVSAMTWAPPAEVDMWYAQHGRKESRLRSNMRQILGKY